MSYHVKFLGMDHVEIIDWTGELRKDTRKAMAAWEYWLKQMYIPTIVKPSRNNNLDSITRVRSFNDSPQAILKARVF